MRYTHLRSRLLSGLAAVVAALGAPAVATGVSRCLVVLFAVAAAVLIAVIGRGAWQAERARRYGLLVERQLTAAVVAGRRVPEWSRPVRLRARQLRTAAATKASAG